MAERLVRLHVTANSDSGADQAVKLQVRDAVLPVISRLTADCHTRAEALAAMQNGLPEIRQTAVRALRAAGSSDSVQLLLTTELFPRRDYETFSLPAGCYETLRVSLGAGAGHNWWCVAFPSLCLPVSSEGVIETARIAGLNDLQIALLTGDTPDIALKFRLLEWLSDWFS